MPAGGGLHVAARRRTHPGVARRAGSQEQLSQMLGFNDRQTLSAIENGERGVSAEELLLLVERPGVSLDYCTDPLRLIGEGRFSWRQTNVGPQRLSAYERGAGRWIAAYRTLPADWARSAAAALLSQAYNRHLFRKISFQCPAVAAQSRLPRVSRSFTPAGPKPDASD